jgi:ABC-type uncharacterized transport system auxiliary subunit
MILEVILSKLDQLNLFENITTNNIYAKPNYILQSELFDFKQVIENDQSYALFQIKFYLINDENMSDVISKTFHYKIKSDTIDAYGAITALNKCTHLMLNDLSLWLYENTKRAE